jgi:hypothetical protein
VIPSGRVWPVLNRPPVVAFKVITEVLLTLVLDGLKEDALAYDY